MTLEQVLLGGTGVMSTVLGVAVFLRGNDDRSVWPLGGFVTFGGAVTALATIISYDLANGLLLLLEALSLWWWLSDDP